MGPFSSVTEVVDTREPEPKLCEGEEKPLPNSQFCSTKTCNEPQEHHHKFAGVAIDELLVIEICAGSARLTKTCRKLGIRGLAIDKITSRS